MSVNYKISLNTNVQVPRFTLSPSQLLWVLVNFCGPLIIKLVLCSPATKDSMQILQHDPVNVYRLCLQGDKSCDSLH